MGIICKKIYVVSNNIFYHVSIFCKIKAESFFMKFRYLITGKNQNHLQNLKFYILYKISKSFTKLNMEIGDCSPFIKLLRIGIKILECHILYKCGKTSIL